MALRERDTESAHKRLSHSCLLALRRSTTTSATTPTAAAFLPEQLSSGRRQPLSTISQSKPVAFCSHFSLNVAKETGLQLHIMAKGAKAGSGGVADAGGDVAGASSSSSSSAAATSAYASLSFAEVLEDLSSRFIVNLPAEELASIERICFQVEQA